MEFLGDADRPGIHINPKILGDSLNPQAMRPTCVFYGGAWDWQTQQPPSNIKLS
jgi:hypothetical protein